MKRRKNSEMEFREEMAEIALKPLAMNGEVAKRGVIKRGVAKTVVVKRGFENGCFIAKLKVNL